MTSPNSVPPGSSTGPMPTFRRMADRIRRHWGRIRAVLIYGAISLVVVHAGVNLWASAQLNHELSTLRSRHEPLSLEETLEANLAPEQNAAPLYSRAFSKLPSADESSRIPVAAPVPPPAGTARTRELVELARQASELPHCRFSVDWSNPVTARLDHLKSMRTLAEALEADAIQQAAAGRSDEAIADADTIFRMSRHLSEEPVMISLLVARRLESTGYSALAAALSAPSLRADQLTRARAALPTTDWSAAAGRTMLTERAFGLWCFQHFPVFSRSWSQSLGSSGMPALPAPLQWLAGVCWSPLYKLDELAYLRYMDQRVHMPASLFTGDGKRVDDVDRLPRYALVSRVLVPAFSTVLREGETREAQLRQARIALALAEVRSKQGAYPDQLPPGGGGEPLPHDPQAGVPFHYRRAGDGYLLYGVGPDHRDDGGADNPGHHSKDIVWHNLNRPMKSPR